MTHASDYFCRVLGAVPKTPEDLRKRFEAFLTDRCNGKDTTKLRFVVE